MTEPTSLAGLTDRVSDFIRRYVVLKDSELAMVALWVVHTHALDAFDCTPYLYITSPLPECGKTRLLEVLESLTPKPWMTGGTSRAALMRKIDKNCPTLLLDESDAAFGSDKEYAETLRGMLNTGFLRHGSYTVCDGQGANLIAKDYKTFCPKAIAGIGKLPSTVVSRSIPIELERRPKHVMVEKWRRKPGWAAADVIRLELAEWATHHSKELAVVPYPAFPAGLSDRTEDALEPLFLLADVAGGHWPKVARTAAVDLMGDRVRAEREAEDSIGLEMITDIARVYISHNDPSYLRTSDLLAGLNGMEGAPWATFNKGEPLNAHRLGRILTGFKIPTKERFGGGMERRRGYARADFETVFERYLASHPGDVSQASKVSNANVNGHNSYGDSGHMDTLKGVREPGQDDDDADATPF